MKNNNVWKALKKSRSSYSWISTQMFEKIQLSWASCGKKVEEFRAWQCKFFSKGSLDSYSHFLFYAWLGISELRGPGFCWAQKGPETQLKEIKKGWDKIWEVKFDPLCGPLQLLKMKFTDLKKKSHLLKFRQFFKQMTLLLYALLLLSATFQEAFRAWNLTRVTHLKKKVNWWNFCHSIGKDHHSGKATLLLINRRARLLSTSDTGCQISGGLFIPQQCHCNGKLAYSLLTTVFQTITKE